jgi:hypothetical protein
MNKSTKIIIFPAILIGIMRPFMTQRHGFSIEGTYEAIAHIVVGMLIAGWILSENKRPYWILLFIITGIEIVCAMRH